jgi:hypothetical protein
MNRFVALFAVAAVAVSANAVIAAGPEGTWTWVSPLHGGREDTLKLRVDSEGPTLCGTYVDGLTNREVEIAPTLWSNETGKIAFRIPVRLNGQMASLVYSGALDEDTIAGKCYLEIDRQVRAMDWLARRKK